MLVAVRLKLVLTGIVTAAAFQFNGLSCHPSATGLARKGRSSGGPVDVMGCRRSASLHLQMAGTEVETTREAAKKDFMEAARKGPKNGVGASPEQRALIEEKLAVLCALNPTPEPAVELLRPPFTYFDGTFSLLYTNTTGGSSGKLGPFVGDVTQTFEGMRDLDDMGFSRRGIFSNAAQFGPLRTSLRARCERRGDSKLAITFEELSVSLFGVQVQKKPFETGGKGTRGSWDLKYMDEDLRVLRTNAGNVLALEKVAPFGGESYMQRQKRIGSQPYEGERLVK